MDSSKSSHNCTGWVRMQTCISVFLQFGSPPKGNSAKYRICHENTSGSGKLTNECPTYFWKLFRRRHCNPYYWETLQCIAGDHHLLYYKATPFRKRRLYNWNLYYWETLSDIIIFSLSQILSQLRVALYLIERIFTLFVGKILHKWRGIYVLQYSPPSGAHQDLFRICSSTKISSRVASCTSTLTTPQVGREPQFLGRMAPGGRVWAGRVSFSCRTLSLSTFDSFLF